MVSDIKKYFTSDEWWNKTNLQKLIFFLRVWINRLDKAALSLGEIRTNRARRNAEEEDPMEID